MPLQLWLLYLGVILAVIVPPGPTALLCITHGARHGWARSLATVFGGVSAAISLMFLSALGVGALIVASDLAFRAIQWLGVAYLVYLGVSTWRGPTLNHRPLEYRLESDAQPPRGKESGEPATDGPIRLRQLFATGYVVGVSNPKDLLFFGALFPQFLNPAQALAPQLALLGLTWVVVEGLVMLAYAAFGGQLMQKLGHSTGGRWVNRVTGAAFIAAAGLLALTGGRAVA